MDGRFYHLPDSEYEKEDLKKSIHILNDKLFIYDNFGRIDWETIKSKIRSASVSYGIKLFYIDNLTALNAHAEDERRNLDALMEEVASLAKELNIWILLVSHLNPPKKGASHESGGRVEQSQFTGSRAIMRWAQFMLGIERNTTADTSEERSKGIVRCIKDRFSGKATGQTVSFIYDKDTGICHASDEDFELEVDETEEDF
jgi:twinkle protein